MGDHTRPGVARQPRGASYPRRERPRRQPASRGHQARPGALWIDCLAPHNWHFLSFGQSISRLSLRSMEAVTAEFEEVGMAERSGSGLDEILARIDERFDRAEEKTDERFDRVDERFERFDERFDRIRFDLADVKDRLDRMEDRMETRLGRIDVRFENVEGRIGKLSQGLVTGAIALSGSIIACFAAMIVLIATQL
jgi:hypothetical protein